MCFRIYMKRIDENFKVKNQVLIRIEFFNIFLVFQLNFQMFQICKGSEKGKKKLLFLGFIYIEDYFVDGILSYIIFVKDNG